MQSGAGLDWWHRRQAWHFDLIIAGACLIEHIIYPKIKQYVGLWSAMAMFDPLFNGYFVDSRLASRSYNGRSNRISIDRSLCFVLVKSTEQYEQPIQRYRFAIGR
jgi:hypothetical protein